MPYLPPQQRSHEQVTRWVRDVVLRQCRTWVAVRAAEIMGYAALDGDMLEHLYLRPDVRRQGIGTLLLDEVRRYRPDGVSLHVFQQNTDARAFYERHGFTVFDTNDGDRNMENLPDMTLRWAPDSARRDSRDRSSAAPVTGNLAAACPEPRSIDLRHRSLRGSALMTGSGLPKDGLMTTHEEKTHATGVITVRTYEPTAYEEPADGPVLSKIHVEESFSGDIAGEGAVEFLQAARADGSASFVGIERVTGTLAGRRGSFLLQDSGTVDGELVSGTWFVVPDSGTGELALRGDGGFSANLGQDAQIHLDYWFE